MSEVTERERALNASIIESLQEGLIVIDLTGRITRANQAAADLYGVSLGELVGSLLRDLPVTTVADRDGHPVAIDRSPVHRALAGERVRGAQLQVVRRDGTALWVEVNSSPLAEADGRPYGALSTYVDVTDRVERERRIRAEADTDELTGLANRRALQRMLRAALGRARARDLSVGVLMLDLAHSESAAHDAAERIEAAFGEPLELDGVEASLRAAVGVACHPGDGDDLESLMAAADRAMYARKAQ